MTDDGPLAINCATHGPGKAAVVCCHQRGVIDRAVGFVENSSDPDDLQAWCDDCEEMYLREGSKTPAFLAFNDFVVVCDTCYARIKRQHSR